MLGMGPHRIPKRMFNPGSSDDYNLAPVESLRKPVNPP